MIPWQTEFARVRIPVLALSGYFDLDEPGALYYQRQHLRYDPQADHTLVIGPYDDSVGIGMPDAQLQGYTLDPAALLDWHALRYQWFDSIFKGSARPPALRARVNYELMGANRWLQTDSIAAMSGGTSQLFLDTAPSDLRAPDMHRWSARAGADRDYIAQNVDLKDRSDATWVEPAALLSSAVPTHYSLLYATDALARPMQLAGTLSGELDFTTNKRDFDFTIALYERTPAGRYLKLFDPSEEFRASYVADRSHRRLLRTGVRQRLIFHGEHLMGAALPAGSRLVLALSIAKRPDQEINYGTGGSVATESIDEARVPLRIRWYASSHVDLPLAQAAPVVTPPASAPAVPTPALSIPARRPAPRPGPAQPAPAARRALPQAPAPPRPSTPSPASSPPPSPPPPTSPQPPPSPQPSSSTPSSPSSPAPPASPPRAATGAAPGAASPP
jgi:hypothetical protein